MAYAGARDNTLVAGHSNLKGIIHTANGDLASYLARAAVRGCQIYTNSTANRGQVFDAFRAANPPAVLISPSISYGEDFPGDHARWQAIAKVPYPPLGDPWVKAKMAFDPTWYHRQAAQGIVQAAGRVVRGPDDTGLTYILDQ